MADLTTFAQPAIERIVDQGEDALLTELGGRLRAIGFDPRLSSDFNLPLEAGVETLGVTEDLLDLGRRYFIRIEKEVFNLVCGSDSGAAKERNEVANAFGIGKEAVATSLAVLLVTHLGLAPAIATVVATLTIKLFFRPAHEAMCEVWKEKLQK